MEYEAMKIMNNENSFNFFTIEGKNKIITGLAHSSRFYQVIIKYLQIVECL